MGMVWNHQNVFWWPARVIYLNLCFWLVLWFISGCRTADLDRPGVISSSFFSVWVVMCSWGMVWERWGRADKWLLSGYVVVMIWLCQLVKHLQVVPLGNCWGRKEPGRVVGLEIRPLVDGLPVGPKILIRAAGSPTTGRLLIICLWQRIFFVCIWQGTIKYSVLGRAGAVNCVR